jgi:transposase
MAYSEDYRRRAIEYYETHTQKELYETFKIYASEINKWKRLLAETGTLEPKYPKTRKKKIDLEKLAMAVEEKPGAYL